MLSKRISGPEAICPENCLPVNHHSSLSLHAIDIVYSRTFQVYQNLIASNAKSPYSSGVPVEVNLGVIQLAEQIRLRPCVFLEHNVDLRLSSHAKSL
jgi:hypothetical protein